MVDSHFLHKEHFFLRDSPGRCTPEQDDQQVLEEVLGGGLVLPRDPP